MKSIMRLLLLPILVGLGLFPSALGQNRCDDAPDYFQPLTSGDGQRYPLTIGPLVWHLVGSGVYPVKGSDGLTHLAFAMQFTNVWGIPSDDSIRGGGGCSARQQGDWGRPRPFH